MSTLMLAGTLPAFGLMKKAVPCGRARSLAARRRCKPQTVQILWASEGLLSHKTQGKQHRRGPKSLGKATSGAGKALLEALKCS